MTLLGSSHMADEIRVVIAEDHPFFLAGLRAALDTETAVRVVAEATDGLTAYESIQSLRPDVAIVAVGLPKLDGVGLVRKIREERLPVEMIFLTVSDDEELFEAALEWGVKGYLLKDCTSAEVVRCVKAVAAGQHCASPSMTTYLVKKIRRIERFARRLPAPHP